MIRNHIAQCAGSIVITAARFNAEPFGNRDLNVVNIVSIPNRFKNAVAEAKNQNVLNGFLAEIMVDAINLPFVENFQKFRV